MPTEHRIFGITGWKNAGKTTLVAALVREFGARGLTVSTVKHAHHVFDIDREGTDSWQHRKAGTKETLLVSGVRWALMHELQDEDEPPLDAMLERLSPCDLVLVEGYKRERHDKIEIIRDPHAADAPRWPRDDSVVALAIAARPDGCPLPCFHPDAVAEIADFIQERLALKRPGDRHAAE